MATQRFIAQILPLDYKQIYLPHIHLLTMTQFFKFLANDLSPKFAIGLQGPTKLKNLAILPKTLCAINE
jgi:hypothetical protein